MPQNTAENADANFEFMQQYKEENNLTHAQLAKLSSYKRDTVRAWFAPKDSTKYRPVPDRAVEIIQLKQQNDL